MGKVLAIGLDAASVPLMDGLIGDGRLPNLERARDNSARWSIDGGVACLRNQQWFQFNFGQRIDEDRSTMIAFDPATYDCTLVDARRHHGDAPQFWDRLDLKSLVFDVPESALVDTGTSVTAWGCHAALFPRSSNPPGLIDEIDQVIGVHPGYGNDFDAAWHDRRAINALADGLVVGAGRRARAFALLDERFPSWDLAVVVMSEMHSAGHFWWHSIEPDHPLRNAPHVPLARQQLERVYEAVDAAVGEMIATAPPDTAVVVFSHDDMRYGHGDAPGMVLLPELMHRLHFGTPVLPNADLAAWKASGCPPVVPRAGWVWRRHMDSMLDSTASGVSRLKRLAVYDWAKRTRVGQWAIGKIKHRPLGAQGIPIPPEVTEGVLDPDRRRAADTNGVLFTVNYQGYWSQMRAFAVPSFNPGAVRINLVGRERDGTVQLEDYERVCDEIEAAVRACTNPRTGNPVVEVVLRPRRANPMDPDGDTADLVFGWGPELIDAFEHPELGLIGPVPAHRPGKHDAAGFLYVDAAGIEPGDRGERPAWDIPPTLLGLVGLDPGPHLEGVSVVAQRPQVTSS
jgi:predicted AlkP superfamily phosphohydrolase/phosphomutase